MKLSTEIDALNVRLQGEYQLLTLHWRQHPMSRYKYRKFIFVGLAALMTWLARYPAVRKIYVLSSLVTKSPFH